MEQQQRDVVAGPDLSAARRAPPPDARLLAEQSAASVLAARLPLWCRTPHSHHVSAFHVPSPLSLSVSEFRWEVESCGCPSLEHVEVSGWLTGLVSVLLSLRGKGSPGRGQRREWPGGRSERMQFVD